jgi:hypothetical protein
MDTGRTYVRALPTAAAVSLALHGAALAWVIGHDPDEPEPVTPAASVSIEIVAPAPPTPDPEPMEVALLDPEPTAAAPPEVALLDPAPAAAAPPEPATPPRRERQPERTAAIETGQRAAIEDPGEAPGEQGTTAPPRSKWFDMRGGNRVDLALPRSFRDDLEHAPAGTRPDPGVPSTGQLAPSGGGRHESHQGTFVASVARDGSVSLKDERNLQVRFAVPRPKDVGRGIASWYESDKGPTGKEGDRALAKAIQVTSGSPVDSGDRSTTVIVPVLAGGFDVTDWLMRRNGADPYAAKKLAFLDSTRDERVQIGKKYRAEQLAQTSIIVQRNLVQVWAALPDPRARKRALFELWDEVVEAGDPKLVEAGRSARKLIIGFIRARLPSGDADAYTPDELAAHNRARQSKARFAPYE